MRQAHLLTGLLLEYLFLDFLGGDKSGSESCAFCFSRSLLRDSDILMTSSTPVESVFEHDEILFEV